MRMAGRRAWGWILSGVALMLGVSSCFRITNPKIYGPPETLYGPPSPKIEADTIPESDTIFNTIKE